MVTRSGRVLISTREHQQQTWERERDVRRETWQVIQGVKSIQEENSDRWPSSSHWQWLFSSLGKISTFTSAFQLPVVTKLKSGEWFDCPHQILQQKMKPKNVLTRNPDETSWEVCFHHFYISLRMIFTTSWSSPSSQHAHAFIAHDPEITY